MKAIQVSLGATSVAGLALCIGYFLKSFYSHAGADVLHWMLAPPCFLARLSGIDLQFERGAGFVSQTHHLIVGPACAGVNFLIVCFVGLYFAFQSRFASAPRKLTWLLASLVAAYLAVIVVNAARIIVSAHLFDLALSPGWLNAERLHRIAGTIIYCGGLLLVHLGAEKYFGDRRARWLPIVCYLGLAIGAPLLLRTWSSMMLEHVLCVLLIASFVLLLPMLGKVKRPA